MYVALFSPNVVSQLDRISISPIDVEASSYVFTAIALLDKIVKPPSTHRAKAGFRSNRGFLQLGRYQGDESTRIVETFVLPDKNNS